MKSLLLFIALFLALPLAGDVGGNLSLSNVTDCANGATICSGSYTPTCTLSTNAAACTVQVAKYTRLGNIVTVSSFVAIDPTTGGIATQIRLTVPILSNFTGDNDCNGSGSSSASEGTIIRSNSANDDCQFDLIPTSASNANYSYIYQYVIK